MNKGASKPPAVTGSITIDNSGMPTIENPPPNAPFMKQIRNTPVKAIKIVGTVSSIAKPPRLTRADDRRGDDRSRRRAQPTTPSSQPRPIRSADETVDRSVDLASYEADVPQCAIVEFAKACGGGATDEIARDRIATRAEKPGECTRPFRDHRPDAS